MTALSEYQRLESSGIWRPSADAQRRDVAVAFGDATVVISDQNDRPLAHWSLPAIERLNIGQRPAVFSPDGSDDETLEIDDPLMIDALEKVRKTIAKRRPRPGRLRLISVLASLGLVGFLGVFWLPTALLTHTVSVVPDVKRIEIGEDLFDKMTRATGPACTSGFAAQALGKLATRVSPPLAIRKIKVVNTGVRGAVALPGGLMVVEASIIEDFEDPAVIAGYLIAASQSEDAKLQSILEQAGMGSSFTLLTTGTLPDAALGSFAETVLTKTDPPEPSADLLDLFEQTKIASTPYAYARDISGETVLDLIEGDPYSATSPVPILSDSDWLRLQGICGG